MAEQQGAETLEIPDELKNVDSSRIQQILAVQQGLFHARRQSYLSTLESLGEQNKQMKEQIEGLKARTSVNYRRIASLRGEAEDFRSLYREAQAQIAQAEEQIASLTDQVERTVIKAPVAGTVVGRKVHSEGAVLSNFASSEENIANATWLASLEQTDAGWIV